MAGDVGIYEVAIVGGADAPDVGELATLVAEEGAGATHRYGRRVLIAAVPPDGAQAVERQVPEVTVAAGAGAVDEATTSGLDEIEALGLEAFALRQSDEYAAAKARRPLDGEPWNTEEALPPDAPTSEELEVPEAESVPTGARLNGRVAVGLIFVEGPTAHNLQFTDAEQRTAVAEVQNGLTWLGNFVLQPTYSRVTWVYDIQTVEVTVDPTTYNPTPNYEAGEAPWRDPALEDLGYEAGHAGVRAYAEDLRTRLNTDSAYCGFFTKYPLHHFAYVQEIGSGPHVVMNYANGPWGTANIDRVFAHETGHIFGAPDEYRGAQSCECTRLYGFCRKPNANCEVCAPGGGVVCIMRHNDWQMCRHTPLHLGLNVRVPDARRPGFEMSQPQAARAMRNAFLEPFFTGQHGSNAWVYSQTPGGGAEVPVCSGVTLRLTTRPKP
jgi:hypothetical protein